MLRFGPDDGPMVLMFPALLEEANRTRALTVDLLRALAARGVASVLPDLPGAGESRTPTVALSVANCCRAAGELVHLLAAARPVHIATMRGGALLEGSTPAASRWRFAPIEGDEQIRELFRLRRIANGGRAPLDEEWLDWPAQPVEIAGNQLSWAFLHALHHAVGAEAGRVVRLESDSRPADHKSPGRALWRAAEPGADRALAAALADDLAGWVHAEHSPIDAVRWPLDRELRDRPAVLVDEAARADRRITAFPCAGETLFGTLDAAPGETGLLIVSGGNEIRVGAHRGMALLAARLAAAGVPAFRFDRRGVGDSTGDNGGYATSAPDIVAAVAAFRRAAPRVERIVGFGNCDAATALALFGRAAGIERLILANPWVVERSAGDPPPAAIRARYAERLRSPPEWWRLARDGVDLRKLARGLRAILAPAGERELAGRFIEALRKTSATIILARHDATAIACADALKRFGADLPTTEIDTASHSFARAEDAAALEAAVLAALRAG